MTNLVSVSNALVQDLEPKARIAYDNFCAKAYETDATHDVNSVSALYDSMTTVKWRPNVNGVSSVTFKSSIAATGVGQKFPTFDCIGVAGCNWATSGALMTVKDETGKVIIEVSLEKDNQPLCVFITDTRASELVFEFDANDTLEVGELFFSKAITMPRKPSVGLQPARWMKNDEVGSSRTEANQFSNSTILRRGSTERATFNLIPISFMEVEFKRFIDEAQGLPIFFCWNQRYPLQSVYGTWQTNSPSYDSGFLSSFTLTISGVTA